MATWEKWFQSIADRIVDQGGFWGGGREFTNDGTKELSLAPDAITGFLIFTAGSLDEAAAIARECPVVAANRVYEIMQK